MFLSFFDEKLVWHMVHGNMRDFVDSSLLESETSESDPVLKPLDADFIGPLSTEKIVLACMQIKICHDVHLFFFCLPQHSSSKEPPFSFIRMFLAVVAA